MTKSVLLPETLAILATVPKRSGAPVFDNPIKAELFDAKNTRGPYKILPTTRTSATGGVVHIIFDTRAPLGKGVVSVHNSEDEAATALAIVPL